MRKFLATLLTVCISFSGLAACQGQGAASHKPVTAQATQEMSQTSGFISETGTKTSTDLSAKPGQNLQEMRILALKGPTAMGMVPMMNDAEQGKPGTDSYRFEIVNAVDEVAPKLVKGEVDLAAVPANLASVLYNNTKGKIQVLAINTLGVLYLVQNGKTIQNLKDLQGKKVFASGKGATPEYVLTYLLEKNGLTIGKDLQVEWKSEHAECVAALAQEPDAIAMLPQPFVAAAQAKKPSIQTVVDLNEEWSKLHVDNKDSSALITGVLVARTEYAEKNGEQVRQFLKEYSESVNFVNSHHKEAADLIGKFEIVPGPIAEKALPQANIVCITGQKMQEQLANYLHILFQQNPASIGGKEPENDFYFH